MPLICQLMIFVKEIVSRGRCHSAKIFKISLFIFAEMPKTKIDKHIEREFKN